MGKKHFSRGILISHLPQASQEDVRRQIGDVAFLRIINKETNQKKRGRYTVATVERRTADGIIFDSGWEKQVYCELRDRVGLQHITLQPRFLLQAAFRDNDGKLVRDIEYVSDFLVGPLRPRNDAPVLATHWVCDAKGYLTREYRTKAKLFKGRYGAVIHEIKTTEDLESLITSINATIQTTSLDREKHAGRQTAKAVRDVR